MIRVLLVGPLPPPMGGATRHFRTLVDDLTGHRNFELVTVDTSRGENHSNPLRNLLVGARTLLGVLRHLARADVVSYHASNRGAFLFAPPIVALCRIARRPVVVRIFGGSFGDYYAARGVLGRAVIRHLVLTADVLLLQTHRAIHQLESIASGRLVWFSTYIRTPPAATPATREARAEVRCRKFVFLGHLWRAKGIEILLESAPRLPEGASIDIFGPIDEYSAAEIDARGLGRVRYRGLLSNDEVAERLWSYDCLVLPTFHVSEGYPAVLAEAYAHGIPVITTRWLAIPEIVDESCGILIPPRETDAFVAAVAAIHDDPEFWMRLKAGAAAKAALFDHARWSRVFEQICEELVGERGN